jgi:hypothetical protein
MPEPVVPDVDAIVTPVPRQDSGTFDFHLGNNVTNLARNSLIFKVARHFGEAQVTVHNQA